MGNWNSSIRKTCVHILKMMSFANFSDFGDIATTFSITSHVSRATSSWPVARKGSPQFGHNFHKRFYIPVDLGITKKTNNYIYIYLCFYLFPDQLQIITNEFYIVENHRKVVLNVSLRLLV